MKNDMIDVVAPDGTPALVTQKAFDNFYSGQGYVLAADYAGKAEEDAAAAADKAKKAHDRLVATAAGMGIATDGVSDDDLKKAVAAAKKAAPKKTAPAK